MSTLIDIQTQIKKLQKQESDIKSKDFDRTRLDILEKMQAFGITIKDLQGAQPRGPKVARSNTGIAGKSTATKKISGASKKSRAGIPVAAKYRGPQGESWSGRGLMPRWLKALTVDGRAKEDFEIKSES